MSPAGNNFAMKVLFLDVDGVLTVPDGSGRLDDAKMRRLQSVVQQTQSVICISSNWRLFPQLKHRLTMALQQYGGMRVIGATPDHGERSHGGAVRAPRAPQSRPPSALLPPSFRVPFMPASARCTQAPNLPVPRVSQVRPEEILSWIKAWRGEPIEVWCAVDDRPLLSERGGHGLEGHFVQVDEQHGITPRAVERLLAVLQTEPDDPEVVGALGGGGGRQMPDESRLSPDSVLSYLHPLPPSKPPTLLPSSLAPEPQLQPGRRSLVASPGHRTIPARAAMESPPRLGTGAAEVQRMAEARGDLALLPRTGGVPSRLQRPASSVASQSAAHPAAMHAPHLGQTRQPFAPPARPRSLPPRQQRPTYMLAGARPMELFLQPPLREAPRTEPPKRSSEAHSMLALPRTAGGQRTRPPRTAGGHMSFTRPR